MHPPTAPSPEQAATLPQDRALRIWAGPFIVFMLFLLASSLIGKFSQDLLPGNFWLANPEYWIYPIQTLVCGFLLLRWWRHYDFHGWSFLPAGIAAGVIAFLIWIAPQQWFGAPPRPDGFNPDLFAETPALYWTTLIFRFLRLVLIVPLLEEIFWRGFLMRYLIRDRFLSVAFGSYAPLAFFGVALGFSLVHSQPDRIPALLTGLLWNALAVRTRSLGSCVVAHAVTNLLLGVYIVRTGQWGFW